MTLTNTPKKDGSSEEYSCGLITSGSWASRIEQWEAFTKTKHGQYILSIEQDFEQVKVENDHLKKSMDIIRFLSFNHEVQYWNDATGTDKEKLNSILFLSRKANWGNTEKIKQLHT
jgi:hypothetical protein